MGIAGKFGGLVVDGGGVGGEALEGGAVGRGWGG